MKKHGLIGGNQELRTHGGYSQTYVCFDHFIIKIPLGMDLEKTAPLLCAGITMYDPLRHWGFTKGHQRTVGIIGIGGLGSIGIKLAKGLGHKVVAISSSANKEKLAHEKGCDFFVISSDPESIKAQAGTCDIIINTVSVNHDINVYMPLLAKSGTIVQLGACPQPHQIS